MQVPKITETHWLKAIKSFAGGHTYMDACNKAIEIALAEQEQLENEANESINQLVDEDMQEQYITADDARKLGAGNAEFQKANGVWAKCSKWCVYNTTHDGGAAIKYRAIKQPVPTCQIKNLDTGKTETMTRVRAKLLQAETKDVCDWLNPLGKPCCYAYDENFEFSLEGIYTHKLRPLKQINWTGSREDVIALLKEKGLL